jgi:hypothetical protein
VTVQDLKGLFDYGYWANDRLCGVLSELTTDQFTQSVAGSYGSIRNTMVHMLMVLDADEAGADAVLEDQGSEPEGGADGQHVHQDRAERAHELGLVGLWIPVRPIRPRQRRRDRHGQGRGGGDQHRPDEQHAPRPGGHRDGQAAEHSGRRVRRRSMTGRDQDGHGRTSDSAVG